MSANFAKKNTIKTTLLNILLAISIPYSMQVIAAPTTLKASVDKDIESSILDNPITQSYKLSMDNLFFDMNDYSKNIDQQETIKTLIESGVKHYRSGNKAQGIIDLNKAWKIAPNMASTGVTLAMHYIKDGQFSKALEIAKQQRSSFPTKSYASIIEGFAYYGSKNKAQSISAFTQALKLNPDNSTASIILASFALNEKNTQKARQYYLENLHYHPTSIRTLMLLSRLDQALGDTKEVNSLLIKAKRQAQNTVLFHTGFSNIYQTLKNYPQAIIEINKAIEIDSENPANQFLLAKLLISNKELSKSRIILSNLAIKFPTNPASSELEGRIALAQNKPIEAISLFQKTLSIKSSTSAIMHLATAQILSGEKELGLSTLRQQIKKEPSNILLRKLFAEQLSKQNKKNEAIEQYEEIVRQQPSSTILMNNLAWLLSEQGNIDKALHYIERANSLAPSNPNILDTYGIILSKKKKYTMAKGILTKASKLLPSNLSIQFHLSQVLVELKDFTSAKELLNKLTTSNIPFSESQKAKKLLSHLESL